VLSAKRNSHLIYALYENLAFRPAECPLNQLSPEKVTRWVETFTVFLGRLDSEVLQLIVNAVTVSIQGAWVSALPATKGYPY